MGRIRFSKHTQKCGLTDNGKFSLNRTFTNCYRPTPTVSGTMTALWVSTAVFLIGIVQIKGGRTSSKLCYQCAWSPTKLAYATLKNGRLLKVNSYAPEGGTNDGGRVGKVPVRVPGGWDKCHDSFQAKEAFHYGIHRLECQHNCYTRVDKNGNLYRGCYMQEHNVDPLKLGCHYQGGSIYCFCDEDLCNNIEAPTAGRSIRDEELTYFRSNGSHSRSVPSGPERSSHQGLRPKNAAEQRSHKDIYSSGLTEAFGRRRPYSSLLRQIHQVEHTPLKRQTRVLTYKPHTGHSHLEEHRSPSIYSTVRKGAQRHEHQNSLMYSPRGKRYEGSGWDDSKESNQPSKSDKRKLYDSSLFRTDLVNHLKPHSESYEETERRLSNVENNRGGRRYGHKSDQMSRAHIAEGHAGVAEQKHKLLGRHKYEDRSNLGKARSGDYGQRRHHPQSGPEEEYGKDYSQVNDKERHAGYVENETVVLQHDSQDHERNHEYGYGQRESPGRDRNHGDGQVRSSASTRQGLRQRDGERKGGYKSRLHAGEELPRALSLHPGQKKSGGLYDVDEMGDVIEGDHGRYHDVGEPDQSHRVNVHGHRHTGTGSPLRHNPNQEEVEEEEDSSRSNTDAGRRPNHKKPDFQLDDNEDSPYEGQIEEYLPDSDWDRPQGDTPPRGRGGADYSVRSWSRRRSEVHKKGTDGTQGYQPKYVDPGRQHSNRIKVVSSRNQEHEYSSGNQRGDRRRDNPRIQPRSQSDPAPTAKNASRGYGGPGSAPQQSHWLRPSGYHQGVPTRDGPVKRYNRARGLQYSQADGPGANKNRMGESGSKQQDHHNRKQNTRTILSQKRHHVNPDYYDNGGEKVLKRDRRTRRTY